MTGWRAGRRILSGRGGGWRRGRLVDASARVMVLGRLVLDRAGVVGLGRLVVNGAEVLDLRMLEFDVDEVQAEASHDSDGRNEVVE